MRVLVVSTYLAPELAGNAPYVSSVCEYLAERGHEVTVSSGFPHYPEWRPLARRKLLSREVVGGTTVIRRWHTVPKRQGVAHRAGYEASIFCGALVSLARVRRPQVVLGFTPAFADGLAAAVASAVFRAPLALVFQDLIGVGARELGVRGAPAVHAVVSRAERLLVARASVVGYVSEGFEDHLREAGASVLRPLQNWSTSPAPTLSQGAVKHAFGWDGQPLCVHGGNLGDKQGLDVLIETAELMPHVRFAFAGDGNQRPRLEALVGERGLENVVFLGSLQAEAYSNVLHAADVLALTQRPSVRAMSLPSKLGAYRATGRPVVASVAADSDTARAIEADPLASVVPAGDASALAAALELALQNPPRRSSSQAASTPKSSLANYEALLEIALGRDPSAPGSEAAVGH